MKAALRIINLEDNARDAELNEAMLSARWPECELVRVDSRQEFLAVLDAGGIDLILSDYTMPAFSGLEALELARRQCPEVPFLFVSGTIGEDAAIEAMKNGATDYVLKHRLMRLIPAADRALREAEERQERQQAEEAMRESEHKYRTLFECLGDAAFLTDDQTGKIIDSNQRAEAALGCARGDIVGRKIGHFARHCLDPEKENEAVIRCDLVRTDGRTIPVEMRNTRLTLYGRPLILRLCHEMSADRPDE
ncbi:MAG: response regulator [Verrucomicrobia bacterium]|nr:response regulator [Verrucomicrobiota bacterium]MDE3098082.1 response regulator [Verrucomicrobiota bacterium]